MKKFLSFIPFVFVLLISGLVQAEMQQGMPQLVTDPRQAFMTGSIVVKGEGAAPPNKTLSAAQKRIMALRAAKVIALREIAEIINGVAVSGETRVADAAVESDAIRASVEGIVKGAQVIKEVYDPMSEMAGVYVSVPLTGPNGVIATLLPQVIPVMPLPQYQPYQPMPPGEPPQQAQAQPKNYDGLILDVREKPFKPALINRVLAKNGEIIYDPTKVAQNILVERGAAEYTNDVGKARALLGERGSSNPLVVKAGGVVKSTDVELAPEDASAVFSSNQSNNFLEGAKVVFVLR
ncbi:MAG: hypothetical protein HZB22_06100 [Deltaproteobacteria bacterium]|nr:hypothetical protein [Deltaproteobacteria bacterium]